MKRNWRNPIFRNPYFGDYISVLVVTSWFVQNHERTVFSPNSIFSGTHLPG